MITRDSMLAQRRRYMKNEISHDEYYLWLAKSIGLAIQDVPFSLERLKASTGPHFNDLPLPRWDSRHRFVQYEAFQRGLAWSLSDTVCCLKALARRAVETSNE